MTFEQKLEKYVDEYLNECDKKNVLMIKFHIPTHEGDFLIMDTHRLCIPNPINTLAIYFTLKHKTRKGRTVQRKIEETDIFKSFIKSGSGNKISYTQVTNNDKRSIKEKIVAIVDTIYPEVDRTELSVNIHKTTNWFKIEE